MRASNQCQTERQTERQAGLVGIGHRAYLGFCDVVHRCGVSYSNISGSVSSEVPRALGILTFLNALHNFFESEFKLSPR